MATTETLYRISFVNQGEVYEVYAENVSQGGLFGFVEVEGLVFGERSKLLIDSSEERLKTEFADVSRFYVPLHSVLANRRGRKGRSRPHHPGRGQGRCLPHADDDSRRHQAREVSPRSEQPVKQWDHTQRM